MNYCEYANRRVYADSQVGSWSTLAIGEKEFQYDAATTVDLEGANINCDVNKPIDWTFKGKYCHVRVGEILEHLENDVALLRQVRDVMRADGTLLITVPFYGEAPYHLRLHNKWSIGQLLSVAGFRVVKYIPRKAQRLDRFIAGLRWVFGQRVNDFFFWLNPYLPIKPNGGYFLCNVTPPIDITEINRKEFQK